MTEIEKNEIENKQNKDENENEAIYLLSPNLPPIYQPPDVKNVYGTCLMEVFRVIINKPGYIWGTIFLDTGTGMPDIYNNPQPVYVKKDGDLLFQGALARTLDCVLIFADLHHKSTTTAPTYYHRDSSRNASNNRGRQESHTHLTNCDCFPNNEHLTRDVNKPCRHDISDYKGFYWLFWHPRAERLLNKPLSYTFSNGKLTATLFFGFFHHAIAATVEVRLINQQQEISVYGCITARNTMIRNPKYKSYLFSKIRKERVALLPGDSIIPLTKSLLAVPVASHLVLHVDLRSNETRIPHGELVFPVTPTMEQVLGGKVHVKVTWTNYYGDKTRFKEKHGKTCAN